MSEPNLATQLSVLIQKQQENANKLKGLLQQEQHYLLEDNTTQLIPVIEQKEALAQQMATTQNQLSTFAQQNSNATEQGLVQFIKQNDPSGQLVQHWEALLESTRDCKQLNESNGSTINLKKRYTDNGLAILRGQIGGNQSTTYSKKGVTSTSQGSRIINKA